MAREPFFVPMKSWQGEHRSYRQALEGRYAFRLYRGPAGDQARLQAYRNTTGEIQRLIGEAVSAGRTLRAHGSSWSLSTVGMTRHRLLDTKGLRLAFRNLPASRILRSYPAQDRRLLCFLECGASVDALNRYLAGGGLSLKASGSNNGQTLAGAISTGTHGSAFRFGSMQDFVVGIHLVVAPDRHVYIERQSRPVVQKNFADSLGAELVRDDMLFNAALVSFGSFGVIQGLMIETRDLFLLHAYRRSLPYDDALRAAVGSLAFSQLEMPDGRSPRSLYHFAATFNPNQGTPPGNAFVDLMFEAKVPADYSPPPREDQSIGPGVGTLEIMAELLGIMPDPFTAPLRPTLNTMIDEYFKDGYQPAIIRDLFRGEIARARSLAVGMGIPLDRTLEALDIAFQTYRQFDRLMPMLFACRYVRGTQALLGFTRFDRTCVLEVDSINTATSRKFLRRLWANLHSAGVPFTLHWGKLNGYLTPHRVSAMYGDARDQWIASREGLIEDQAVRRVFNNPFLERVGLA